MKYISELFIRSPSNVEDDCECEPAQTHISVSSEQTNLDTDPEWTRNSSTSTFCDMLLDLKPICSDAILTFIDADCDNICYRAYNENVNPKSHKESEDNSKKSCISISKCSRFMMENFVTFMNQTPITVNFFHFISQQNNQSSQLAVPQATLGDLSSLTNACLPGPVPLHPNYSKPALSSVVHPQVDLPRPPPLTPGLPNAGRSGQPQAGPGPPPTQPPAAFPPPYMIHAPINPALMPPGPNLSSTLHAPPPTLFPHQPNLCQVP